MMEWQNYLLSTAFFRGLACSLMHIVWQGALLAACVAAVAPQFKTAAAKYWLHFLALSCLAFCLPMNLLLLTQPAVPSPASPSWSVAQAPPIASVPSANAEESATNNQVSRTTSTPSHAPLAAPTDTQPTGSVHSQGNSRLSSVTGLLPFDLQVVGVTVYIIGVLFMLARVFLGQLGSIRFCLQAKTLESGPLVDELARRVKQLKLQAAPILKCSHQCIVPTVAGFVKPAIILPTSMLAGMTPDQASTILMHELVHLRRHDLLFNLAQRFIECLLFFHPATWWLSSQTSVYREQACDDQVVQRGCSRRNYVEALLQMAELSLASREKAIPPEWSLAATGTSPSELRVRILRLLGETTAQKSRTQRLFSHASLTSLLATLALLAGSAWVLASDRNTSVREVVAVTQGEWPQWGGNAHRNNATGGKAVESWVLDSGKNVEWRQRIGGNSYFAPVVANGQIYCGTFEGNRPCLQARDRQNGRLLWSYQSDKLNNQGFDWPAFGICSTPAVDGGNVYFLSNRCEVVCLNEKDGATIWKTDLIAELEVTPCKLQTSSPTIIEDVVLIGTSHGFQAIRPESFNPAAPSFIALDRTTGDVIWQDNSPGANILHGQWSSPAFGVFGGVPQAIFAGGDGWLYSFDFRAIREGKTELLWKFDCNSKSSQWIEGGRGTRNSLIATPVIHEGLVYIGTGQNPEHGDGDGTLWCIDPTKRGDVSAQLAFVHKAPADYRLKASDVLGIHFGDQLLSLKPATPDLDGLFPIPVQGDGMVNLPLLPHLKLAGKSLSEAKSTIRDAYRLANVLEGGEAQEIEIYLRANIPASRTQAAHNTDKVVSNPNSAAIWQYEQSDQNSDGEISIDERFHRTTSSVAIRNGMLVASDFSGILHCLNARTGAVHWTYDMLACCYSTPLIVEDHIYVGNEDGEVIVLELTDSLASRDGMATVLDCKESITGPLTSDGRSIFIPTTSHLISVAGTPVMEIKLSKFERWKLHLPAQNVDEYVAQLEHFQIDLACVGGGISTVDYLQAPVSAGRTRAVSGPKASEDKRLYLAATPGSEQWKFDQSLLTDADIETQQRTILKYLPAKLELALAELEVRHAQSQKPNTTAEIIKTVFESRPTTNGFQFVVKEQVTQ